MGKLTLKPLTKVDDKALVTINPIGFVNSLDSTKNMGLFLNQFKKAENGTICLDWLESAFVYSAAEGFAPSRLYDKQNVISDMNKYYDYSRIKALENKIDSFTPWIKGEYKWMPTTITTMPNGWKKVNINNGYTLVQGVKEETTTGEAKRISDYSGFMFTTSGAYLNSWDIVSGAHNLGNIELANGSNLPIRIEDLKYSGNQNTQNLPAGISTILWQYDPSGSFTFTRELAIKIQDSYNSKTFDNKMILLKQEFEDNINILDENQIKMLKDMLENPEIYFYEEKPEKEYQK